MELLKGIEQGVVGLLNKTNFGQPMGGGMQGMPGLPPGMMPPGMMPPM